ncbi:AfsR/SARP family transcriptional regulator [Plantactinospora sp. CA-294935]|uniref:AfsR/SARP family transcriptional regulator n=1 Tax=Plantactinospora sp. CA-294935 TaxID=3240012 RepID=UPI003D8FFD8B
MDLRLLGNVLIQADHRTIDLERSAERCVLATLAFSPGHPVRVDTLIDNIWGDRRPNKAEQTVASYARAVRRAIEEAGGQRGWLLNRRPRAYELHVIPAAVDYHRFTALLATGRAKTRNGNHHEAILGYQQALHLWRADPLANVNGDWADRRRHALRQERLDALCALFELQLKTGDHEAVASEATRLANEIVPTDRLITLAIQGLAHSGHASMIPGFVSRAAERMWTAVQVRPGPHIDVLVRRLVRGTVATDSNGWSEHLPFSPAEAMAVAVQADEDEAPEAVDPSVMASARQVSADGIHGGQAWQSSITMTAMFSKNVYQAAGDQYITET